MQTLPDLQQTIAPLAEPAADHATAIMLLGILEQLHAEQQRGRFNLPLAAMCKRLGIRMSTLQRHLTALEEQGIVELSFVQARWVLALTAAGEAAYDEIIGTQAS